MLRRGFCSFSNEERHLYRVRQNGLNLRDVPDNEKTLEICRAAMKQDLDATNYVPYRFREQMTFALGKQLVWNNEMDEWIDATRNQGSD